ncbi:hypothetical protein TNCV_360011 [Trichonephila clavipes]|uniref:Uncharacterized protein n=1 Tax=Trichonephila clavipes TaxID=2585209 RepID=A0A8X6VK25_TRICX|nr:hypothetical protein TNCV_360011 [Trichonephila clavipes]
MHRCPTRWVFSGTGLELVTRQATVRYLYHSATAATQREIRERFQQLQNLTQKYALLKPEVTLTWTNLTKIKLLDINKEEFQLERVRLQAFVATTDAGKDKLEFQYYPHTIILIFTSQQRLQNLCRKRGAQFARSEHNAFPDGNTVTVSSRDVTGTKPCLEFFPNQLEFRITCSTETTLIHKEDTT